MVFAVPTDVLADILARLPTNARRRVRLVCRLWCNLVDEWAPVDMRRRDKILAVESRGFKDVVHVLSLDGSRAELWRELDGPTAGRYGRMSVVGTCNGLVCLCDDTEPGGAITLANPSTGEELRFTLGEASWRVVHAGPSAKCSPGLCSLTIVDATLYWLTEDDDATIRSFDLDHERVTRTGPLPVPAKLSRCRLAKVHGMLGVAVAGGDGSTTVWVLEVDERWSLRFVMEAHGPRQLAMPHFAHGDKVLTHSRRDEIYYLHQHKTETGVGQIGQKDGEEVTRLEHSIYRTFAYIETKEQLSVYSAALVTKRRRNH